MAHRFRQTSAKAACNADDDTDADDDIASVAVAETDGVEEAEEAAADTIEWRATIATETEAVAVAAALVLVLRVCAGGGGM